MTTDEGGEDPIVALGCLPAHEPDRRSSERVRARCQAALARRKRRLERAEDPTAWRWRRALEPALAAGVSVPFLLEVMRRALELYGLWRS